jgi:hypothetical protein
MRRCLQLLGSLWEIDSNFSLTLTYFGLRTEREKVLVSWLLWMWTVQLMPTPE